MSQTFVDKKIIDDIIVIPVKIAEKIKSDLWIYKIYYVNF